MTMTRQLGRVVAVGVFLTGALTGTSLRADDETPIHDVSANVALTSNYMFRGVSQTDNGPAIQGGFDYEYTPLGLYIGVWASNVDGSTGRAILIDPTTNPPTLADDTNPNAELWVLQYPGYDGASMEIDAYLGWRPNWETMGLPALKNLAVDIGYLRYNYPNSGTEANNTNEYHISLGYDVAGLFTPTYTANYSEDFYGLGSAWYHNFELSVPLPYDFTLHGNYGLTRYDNSPNNGGGESYDDYSAGLSYSYGGFDFDLSYIGRNKQELCYSPFRCDDTAVFTVSKTF